MTVLDFREIASKAINQHASEHRMLVNQQVLIVLDYVLDRAERGEMVMTYSPFEPLMKETVEILKNKHQLKMVICTKTGEGTKYTISISANDEPFYP